ncbi:MAG TPA: LacI family DNA-binding transcriptional regulator [Candidatus Brocadiia bacterium]|nr:LacI family DNA-binding transcriptional regulator [Candidatus Brocadiia bacterium]
MSLRSVAEKANVSIMTVSRVLSGKGPVAAETRERVLAVSEKLGFFPRRRRMAPTGDRQAGPMPAVAVLIDSAVSSAFLSELLLAIQRELSQNGFQCSVISFSGDYAGFLRALEGVRPPAAAGLLAVGHFTDQEVGGVIAANPACVFVDYLPKPSLATPINVVAYNNVAAATLATQWLAGSGRKRIALIQGPEEHNFSRAMREGFLAALNRADFEEGQLYTANFTPASGYEAMRQALAARPRPDAVFTTDEMAFGAIRAIREAGLRIPEDIAIMGCDGIELGKELTPPLSTVALDRQALGQRAVKRLVEILSSDKPTVEHILLAPRLVIRGVAAAGARA